MSDLSKIPGIAEAKAIEREKRQEAWLELEEPLCGVDVNPLTLRHCLYLDLSQNWYAVGKPEALDPVEPEFLKSLAYQQTEYLWVVSKAFKSGDIDARDKFARGIPNLDILDMDSQITNFHEQAFFDAPDYSSRPNFDCPLVDWVALIIHEFSSSYGWGYHEALDTPLRILLQLRRCIKLCEDPKARDNLGNPLSDKAKAAWLREINGRAKEN